ncbi:hydroxyectoine utilization dehydratase EutB [Pelagovum pacificum]|uniref:Hydroxyectoine utilization dehydratase EutB n=1 Tax=Pelagovum pacificum TaxID=2588711 RepID=A0A5C5GGI1_9RHOB|nr:hydroxyectoine utilization dehydratase EutB [Pelagovum pacificum]QQA43010.1 hydroxyectoine utilization dehydratase EutB [Pelagovum pacificum]TNY33845.1 hydroxyectoine utilization dehydratase EutB [Pelagovum pacificum]
MLKLADVMAARKRIAGIADHTPLVPSPSLSGKTGQEVLLKLELAQPTGAFKLRGALNAVGGLGGDVAGVTCCSTGNHGRGIAYAAQQRGIRAVICMSSLVHQAKVDGIRALGAEVRIHGRSQDEAQEECLRLVAEEGLIEVPPFDDPLVIAGQGTIGLELLEARPDLSAILVPLSGGGLAAGVALAAKAIRPDIRLIGVTMDRGPAMYHSIRAGAPVDVEEVPSLADSLGGGIGEDNRWTLPMCRDLLDETVLVTEQEIYDAVRVLYFEDRLVAEGASVVGSAALLTGKVSLDGPAAVLVTGRNADMAQHARIIAGERVALGDIDVGGPAAV